MRRRGGLGDLSGEEADLAHRLAGLGEREHVPDVDHVRVHRERGLHAVALGARGERDRVVAQRLRLTRLHEEGRQAAQIGVDRRDERVLAIARRVAAHVGLEHRPREVVEARVGVDRRAAQCQIRPRRDRDEAGRQRLARVAQGDRRGEREPSAGALSRDHHPRRVDPALEEPVPGDHRVVDRRGEGVLGREPVVDGEGVGAGGLREAQDEVAVGVDAADRVAAAVQVEDPAVVGALAMKEPARHRARAHVLLAHTLGQRPLGHRGERAPLEGERQRGRALAVVVQQARPRLEAHLPARPHRPAHPPPDPYRLVRSAHHPPHRHGQQGNAPAARAPSAARAGRRLGEEVGFDA